MKAFTVAELYDDALASGNTWLNSRKDVILITMQKDASLAIHAYAKDAESKHAYFWIREPGTSGVHGYTIAQYYFPDSSLTLASVTAQFINQKRADDAVEAFARERIDSNFCVGAFRSRGADCVSDVILYKRNQSRSGSIADYRKQEKARTIPRKPELQCDWLAGWIKTNLSQARMQELVNSLTV